MFTFGFNIQLPSKGLLNEAVRFYLPIFGTLLFSVYIRAFMCSQVSHSCDLKNLASIYCRAALLQVNSCSLCLSEKTLFPFFKGFISLNRIIG